MDQRPAHDTTVWLYPFSQQDWDQTPSAVQAYLCTLQVVVKKPAPVGADGAWVLSAASKQRRYAQALRGFWPYCPVSSASHADRLAAHFQTRGECSENQSLGIVRKLDTFVDGVTTLIHQGQYGQAQTRLAPS